MSRAETVRGYVSVAVPIPARRLFTYSVPDSVTDPVEPGCRVKVRFGRRRLTGTVVATDVPPPENIEVRPIIALEGTGPVLSAEILDLARFVTEYYLCSWGEAIEAALPPLPGRRRTERLVRRLPGIGPESQPARATARRRILACLPADRSAVRLGSLSPNDRRIASAMARGGLLEILQREMEPHRRVDEPPIKPTLLQPTPEQQVALDSILPAVEAGRYAPFLIHGVTGSGKTEVYLRAAEACLQLGRGVLYLVPEIGLTPLLMSALNRRFGGAVTVLHSGLNKTERYDHWRRVRSGDCRFVVGTRSAVFAPVRGTGLIVVDEEHDWSYKQEDKPRYNGRDLAIYRGRQEGAVVLLGSATPSLESYRNAGSGRYRLLTMWSRVRRREMPRVDVVDMRHEMVDTGEAGPLSRKLVDSLRSSLDRGEQALILRNRRGWSVSIFCTTCSQRIRCPDCSISMTWHRSADRLRCHACNRERPTPQRCPGCGGEDLRFLGEGAERIESELQQLLPGARIARMDRDSVRNKGVRESLLRRFDALEIDILVGTQMIAKGHDFPGVTLVGVLAADQSLGLPDFRAGERTFQLLTQVAGRSGRGRRPGTVVLQAYEPSHKVMREAIAQDYVAFYERELEYRRTLRYPPFTALVQLLVTDRDPVKAMTWAASLADAVRSKGGGRIIVSGPGPAPVERIKGKYRQQILARSAGRRKLVGVIDRALDAVEGTVPARALQVDVDPYSLL